MKGTARPPPRTSTRLVFGKHSAQFVVMPLGTRRLQRPSEAVLDILSQPQRGALRKEGGEAVVSVEGFCV